MGEPALHALLVGIDRHRPERIPGGGLIPDLQGSVADVERVEAFLRSEPLSVPGERIRKLVAPGAVSGRPEPPPDGLPTYRNLVRELEALGERAAPGDRVLVHYSGHGARLPTVVPDKKGPRARDECLVPCDAGVPREEGGGFLRDVELHVLLLRLAERRLRVTLVLDCCHSGGVTREAPGSFGDRRDGGSSPPASSRGRVRGLGDLAVAPEPPGPLGSWEDLGDLADGPEAPHARPPDRFRHVAGAAGWFPQPEGCVLLAACRSTELAREYPFEGGRWSGALTHFVLRAAEELGPGPPVRRLHDRLLAGIRSLFQTQTPVLEGDGDRVFLGGEPPGAGPGPKASTVGSGLGRGEHLVRYRAVAELSDAGSPLSGALRAELFALEQIEDWLVPGARRPVGPEPVLAGTLLCLRVENRSRRDLNVAVLDLQPDGGIARVHPRRGEGDYTTLDPGGELPVFLRACLPEGFDRGRDRLKIVGATGPLDVSPLELPALQGWPGEDRDERVPGGLARSSAPGTAPEGGQPRVDPSRTPGALPAVIGSCGERTVETVEVTVTQPDRGQSRSTDPGGRRPASEDQLRPPTSTRSTFR